MRLRLTVSGPGREEKKEQHEARQARTAQNVRHLENLFRGATVDVMAILTGGEQFQDREGVLKLVRVEEGRGCNSFADKN